MILVTARHGTLSDPAVRAAGNRVTAQHQGDPHLSGVTSWFTTPSPTLHS